MVNELELSSQVSPEGAVIFRPSTGGINIDLEAEDLDPVDYYDEPEPSIDFSKYRAVPADLYPTTPKTNETPSFNTKGKVVCFDTETTGISPLSSKLVVCTFWDLSKGPETMETFSGWDEEIIIKQIAAYLNREQPETLVAYNMGFDLNFLLTRMMAFGVTCPPMKKMKNYDILTIFGQGGESFAKAISKVGTAEDWLQYFYGESKPFTIDELLEGYKKKDLVPAIVRNHACVYAEGRFYQLIQEVYGGAAEFRDELVATEYAPVGTGPFAPKSVNCPNCLTRNVCKGKGTKQECVVCRTDLTSLCSRATE